MREAEEAVKTLADKHERDMEELRQKHKQNLELMEAKFNTEHDLLNDEFLFLKAELEKLQIQEEVRGDRDRQTRETPLAQNKKIEAEKAEKLAGELEQKARSVQNELSKMVR